MLHNCFVIYSRTKSMKSWVDCGNLWTNSKIAENTKYSSVELSRLELNAKMLSCRMSCMDSLLSLEIFIMRTVVRRRDNSSDLTKWAIPSSSWIMVLDCAGLITIVRQLVTKFTAASVYTIGSLTWWRIDRVALIIASEFYKNHGVVCETIHLNLPERL